MPLNEVSTLPYLLQRIAHELYSWHADFRKLGLSGFAVRTLAVMSVNKKATVGELAEATFLDQPTLSHILRRLSRSGYVEKSRSAEDSRSVLVTLTPKGRRMAKRALDTARSHDDELTNGLTAGQAIALREALETLHANIQRRGQPIAPPKPSRPRKATKQ